MKTSYDYIVIGVGGMGSAAAYWLARTSGGSALGLEQFELNHPRGGSHDHSRIIRRAYHMPEYTVLADETYRVWDDMQKEAGEQVVFKTGGLNFGTPGSDAENYITSMQKQKIPHEVLTPGEVMKRWPQFKLTSNMVAAYQADGGFVDPSKATLAHIRLARARGATILDNTAVQSIDIRGGQCRVVTAAGTFEAGKLVLTSGAWTNRVLASLGLELPLTVTQEQVTYFVPPTLEDFSPARFPIWIAHDERGLCFYGFPVYGEKAAKAAEDAGGRFVTADTRTFEPDPENLERVTQYLKKHIPSMLGPILRTKTCLYTMPPDRNFILDQLPGYPQVCLSIGAGHMFKFASLVGKILSQLAIQGKTQYPIDIFTLKRKAITDPNYPKAFHI
jgi:sarcosine oxidase